MSDGSYPQRWDNINATAAWTSESTRPDEISKLPIRNSPQPVLDEEVYRAKERHTIVVQEHSSDAWRFKIKIEYQDVLSAPSQIRSCQGKCC
jgi:hypothetical protein